MNTTYPVGSTGKIITLRAYNTSDGSPYTAGAYNTSGLSLTYTKDGGTPQAITPVAATAGTYTSGGFVHRGKGQFEVGAPTAAFSTAVDGVEFAADGITGVVFVPTRVDLVAVDPRSATPPQVLIDGGTVPTTPVAGSVGEVLAAQQARIGRRGTAQAGAANTITLDAGASAIDNTYRGHEIKLLSGTGSGQHATCLAYNGTTKVATIGRKGDPTLGWDTNPDNTSIFLTTPQPLANVGLWDGVAPGALPTNFSLLSINGSGAVTLVSAYDLAKTAAQPGSAMTLTSGERTAIAAAVEAAILNEGDGSAVQQAIVDKINATDTNLAGLTLSAIAQAARDVTLAGAAAGGLGAMLTSIYARLGAPAGASMSADVALLLTDLLLVKAKTDNLPSDPADASDIASAVAALPTSVATAVFAHTFGSNWSNKTFDQMIRAIAALAGGPTSGAGTNTEIFHDLTGGVVVTVNNTGAGTDRASTVLA